MPKMIYEHFFTVGLGLNPCLRNQTWQGTNVIMFAAPVNVTFKLPTSALLQSHFFEQSRVVYSPVLPVSPQVWFNYTGIPPNNTEVGNGTRVVVVPYNTKVELVMQDTILGAFM